MVANEKLCRFLSPPADFRLERADFRPGKADFRQIPDYRGQFADSLGEGGKRTDEWTDGRTDGCTLYKRTKVLFFYKATFHSGLLPKKGIGM